MSDNTDYAALMEAIAQLNAQGTRLADQPLRAVNVHREAIPAIEQPFTDSSAPHPVQQRLASLSIKAGWICWPSHIEIITDSQSAVLDCPMPPLEAELLLEDGSHINLTRSSGHWHWCQTRLENSTPAEADALAQLFTVQTNTPGQVVDYWRIWRWADSQGMVLEDALFAGFREEKQ